MLPIFPPHGLDQTIHVAVLVGLVVLLLATEWFGWVWSGLVVPGYLASVFLIQPAAGVTIVGESVLTFAIARAVSDLLGALGAWSRFFGRERFLLIIVVSVIVRQSSQLWLLPWILGLVDARFGTSYRLEGSFSSIGLVLVPLTANMFWKLDVRRGLVQVGVPTVITYLILRHVLLPLTNLSYSSLSLTYENVALDFLASPKAYIILLTGTYVAARYNLLYGWDYNGILIPALLALACFSPIRLVTTAVEAVLLVYLVRALLALPWLRTLNLEGARKITLVFALSFALKLVLGWLLALPRAPVVQVTELFGFGYILPSLLAAKMLARESVGRVLYPTYQAALVALVVGSAAGFALDQLAPAGTRPLVAADAPGVAPTTVLTASPGGVVALARARARLDVAGEGTLRRPYHELGEYAALWRAVDGWLAGRGDEREVRARAARRGLALHALPDGGFALIEAEERLAKQLGWDSAVLYPGAPGPVLEVPRPTEEGTAEAAVALCPRLRCRAILVSGVDTAAAGLVEGDALAAGWAPLNVAHGALTAPVLQLRGDERMAAGATPVLHVRLAVPDALAGLPPPVELSWQPPPGPTQQWALERPLSVLRARADAWWRIVDGVTPPAQRLSDVSPAALLARGFGERPDAERRPPPAPAHVAPAESELRFGEAQLAPALLRGDDVALRWRARLLGYDAVELSGFTALAEPAPRLGWGTVIVQRAATAPIAVEVPRPLREGGTWRLAVELFEALPARALVVAAREARVPGADAVEADATRHPFQAWHQALHAALADDSAPVVLQVRGYAIDQPVTAPLVVALGKPLLGGLRREAVPLDAPWIRLAAALGPEGPLAWAGRDVRYFDGGRDLLGLSGIGNPQLHYATQVGDTAFALLWFSDAARRAYVGRPLAREAPRFAAAGLALPVAPAAAALLEPPLGAPPERPSPALAARAAAAIELARRYAAEENVHVLRQLARGGGVTAGYDEARRLAWLRVEIREGRETIRALVPLSGEGREEIVLAAGGRELPRQVNAELFRRPRVLRLVGSAP